MWTILTALALGSALAALISALSALQAGLKLRRTRVESQVYLFNEVARLAGRATELEKNLAALDVRAQALPIRIAELQQNLSILRVLANTLGASLRQAQKILPSPASNPPSPDHSPRPSEPVPKEGTIYPSGGVQTSDPDTPLKERLGDVPRPDQPYTHRMDKIREQEEETLEILREKCEVCGMEMFGLHCKVICPNCGYRRDCSDP